MGRFTVQVNEQEFNEARAMLVGVKDGLVRAYSRALNKSAEGTQTDMVAIARDDYSFKADAVRARMSLDRSTWSKLSAAVHSKGSGVNLSDFLGTRQTSTGLTVNVKKSTGLQYIRHAFLQKGKYSGKILAFWRAEKWGTGSERAGSYTTELVARYPIEALYGPHPEVVWNTSENWAKLSTKAGERMDAAFSHEVDYVLQQYG